ncbi:MAG: NAD(P)-dependent alcohol dehydrogenase, partial [Planctomycetota bacterium]|nr:NAD(P)-dependent alcohol dehydrogenase [Planctomycetota bacterium]
TFDPGPLGPEQVEIAVEYCGVCHSDLSMRNNDWHMTRYPFVGGHEVVGRVAAAGPQVPGLKVGDRVGLGWYTGACLTCRQCLGGDHNLCGQNEQTIVGRHGGFATRVRTKWIWATPLPDALDARLAGPLFCGGITVFNPIVQFGVRPTDRVGVVGIGGLGHLALQFLNKWGCEVVALTSSDAKKAEAASLGAHRAVSIRDDKALKALAGSLNFILVTANASLNWPLLYAALAPKGRLHVVGAVPEPIPSVAFQMIMGQLSLSGSPLGSPATTRTMLDFVARHDIRTWVEEFPMSDINRAFEHLESGKARYRVVLKNDLG